MEVQLEVMSMRVEKIYKKRLFEKRVTVYLKNERGARRRIQKEMQKRIEDRKKKEWMREQNTKNKKHKDLKARQIRLVGLQFSFRFRRARSNQDYITFVHQSILTRTKI